ncbi:MAG: hypothetical protein K2I72_01345, partial [Bacilli bacterium]|nr:hypothetical protein [Bacilli bacterium]
MKEMFSNREDCKQIATILYKKLGSKFEIYGGPHRVVDGDYHSLSRSMYPSYQEYNQDRLHFYYKFCKNGFLRIGVENC